VNAAMPRCEPGAFPALSSGVGAAIAMRFEGAAPWEIA